MDHSELISEMIHIEHMSTQERLHLARRRRIQQLKYWVQREKERIKHRKGSNNANKSKKHIYFSDNVMLLEAASRNDIQEVRRLLAKGVSPDSTNEDGLTALHQCCIDNNEEMMRLLIEFKANVNAEDSEKWTPLHAAATCGHLPLVKYLINHGANLLAVNADGNMPYDICEDETALDHIESEMARRGVTQELIDETRASTETCMLNDLMEQAKQGGDLEWRDAVNATPLHIAAANGYLRVVEFLLDQHVSTDVKDKDGWQPVHAAACWGHLEILEVLVQNGADLNAKTKHDETPADICEDPELRDRIVTLKTEQETKKVEQQRKRLKRTQSNNTRAQSVRRTSIRDKVLITKKDAYEETRLRLQAANNALELSNDTNNKYEMMMSSSRHEPDGMASIDSNSTPTSSELIQMNTTIASISPTINSISPSLKQSHSISPTLKQSHNISPSLKQSTPILTSNLKQIASISPTLKQSQYNNSSPILSHTLIQQQPSPILGTSSNLSSPSSLASSTAQHLPTETSYSTEEDGKINIHVSVTINTGTLAELKKQRAQSRTGSTLCNTNGTNGGGGGSITNEVNQNGTNHNSNSNELNTSVKRFVGNTEENQVIGNDTKTRHCCLLM